jgi:hypothetical protein
MPHLKKKKTKKKKTTKLSSGFMLGSGEAFESMGSGKFAKDILHVGTYKHPVTGKVIEVTPERITRIAKHTQEYIANGNDVFFPDGHTTEATKNLGDWPGPFFKYGDRLMGVVEPKKQKAIEGVADKTINRVSAYIDFDVKDGKGNVYPEVITHVCATPMPVIGGQSDFVKLSRDQDEAGGDPIYVEDETSYSPQPAIALALAELADVCRKWDPILEGLADLAKFRKG